MPPSFPMEINYYDNNILFIPLIKNKSNANLEYLIAF